MCLLFLQQGEYKKKKLGRAAAESRLNELRSRGICTRHLQVVAGELIPG